MDTRQGKINGILPVKQYGKFKPKQFKRRRLECDYKVAKGYLQTNNVLYNYTIFNYT